MGASHCGGFLGRSTTLMLPVSSYFEFNISPVSCECRVLAYDCLSTLDDFVVTSIFIFIVRV